MSTHETPSRGAEASPSNTPHRPGGLVVLCSAVVAGLLVWGIGESSVMWAVPRKVPLVTTGRLSYVPSEETLRVATAASAARQTAVFGALLGVALAATGGIGSGRLHGAAIGGLLAAVAGAGVAYAGVFLFERIRYSTPDELIPSFLFHSAVGAAVGAFAGLGLGIATGRGTLCALLMLSGGALGALVGTAAYLLLGAVAFSTSDASEPIPGTLVTRMAARLIVAGFIAAGALASLGLRRRTPAVS